MSLTSIAKRFRIDQPEKFRLAAHDPAECYGLTVDKRAAKAMLSEGIERLSDLQERLYADGDVAERKLWDKYMATYEDMIRQTSRPEAPWFVVPADHKWFTRLVVAGALVRELAALDLEFPKVKGKALKELRKVERALKTER